ncbi:aspartic proteinase 36 [Cicer arietinum]|uniref:Aspartic protease n=1 Tax=Cicer arietinum TaxID=3827 RepID=A0A0A7TZ03_CICAR|nr:aspartic proteinase-like protein 2 [Cicer arietinum]AJA74406.1 aspartic protease [Cicer arietinum]
MQFIYITLLLLASIAAPTVCTTYLPLKRVIPLNHHVKIDTLIARDRVRHSRILGGVGVNFSVQGIADPNSFGLYTTKVELGSPPREFTVQIDTGSDVLWVNCNPCTGCPHSSGLGIELNFFDTTSSSTAALVHCSDPICSLAVQGAQASCSDKDNHNQCSYAFLFQDNSATSGFYLSDNMYFDTIIGHSSPTSINSSATILFGCSTKVSGGFTKTARAFDGIFGFGPNDVSVVSQLSSQGKTPKVFSHCLKGDGNGGGILVIGEILEPNIVYSPMVPSRLHYVLNLQSISINGNLLSINPAVFVTSDDKGIVVDSGTTLAYLIQEAYDPLVNAITTAISQLGSPAISEGSPCYLVSTSIDIFPSITFNFAGGAHMVLKPAQYLVHNDFLFSSTWCIGFQKIQSGPSILGDLVLKDRIVVYDLDNQRIGWTDYNCSMPVNISMTRSKDRNINPRTKRSSASSSELRIHCTFLHVTFVAFLMHILYSS